MLRPRAGRRTACPGRAVPVQDGRGAERMGMQLALHSVLRDDFHGELQSWQRRKRREILVSAVQLCFDCDTLLDSDVEKHGRVIDNMRWQIRRRFPRAVSSTRPPHGRTAGSRKWMS